MTQQTREALMKNAAERKLRRRWSFFDRVLKPKRRPGQQGQTTTVRLLNR